jgi:hypothetical protein
MIVAIIYFLFTFNENARENLLATKVIRGGRAKVGCFFVMSMVTVIAIAMTTIVMINPHLFYQDNGTMAAINAPENLWATKGIVGEREIGDWFIIRENR